MSDLYDGAVQLPEPLVPADVDLRDFAFTPMYRARLFGSAFHARVSDAEWRAGVTLWLKSQDQSPSGSLPDDDIDLCRLAELGRDVRTWRKLREGALRGWIKCTDGRLYHSVVAEITNAMWQKKLAQRDRTEKARLARLSQRERSSVTEPPPVSVTDSKGPLRDRDREGTVKGSKHSDADASVVGAPAADPPPPQESVEIPGFLDRFPDFVKAYNALAAKVGLPQAQKFTEARKRRLKARLREHGAEAWPRALAKLEANAWMHGDNDRGWRADFDFLLQADSFSRLIEGGYDRHPQPQLAGAAASASNGTASPTPGFVPAIDPRAIAEFGDTLLEPERVVPE